VTFQRGQFVRHPKCPDWGIGEVRSQEGETVHVRFQQVGKKKLDTRFVNLQRVEAEAGFRIERAGVRAQSNVDMGKLEALCLQFHEEMKDNRSNTDDGGMGLNVLHEMKDRDDLTRTTRDQLLAWCHTEGPLYQEGVDLAQNICREIYGRVPTRDEVE